MTGVETVEVTADDDDIRLDRWFRRRYPGLKHGALEKLLRTGQIRIDGKRVKANFRLTAGQQVRIPPQAAALPSESPRREVRKLDAGDAAFVQSLVIYRDDDVIALNKPPGLAVQGGTKTTRHLDAMLDGLRFGAKERPKLVHRLDRDTSGVLLLARNAKTAARLGKAFQGRNVRKIYWALVAGVPAMAKGRIDLPLGKRLGPRGERMMPDEAEGKSAITLYSVIESAANTAAWLALWPLTGRTHQLRVHCAAIGHPIAGDGNTAAKRLSRRPKGWRTRYTCMPASFACHTHPGAANYTSPPSCLPIWRKAGIFSVSTANTQATRSPRSNKTYPPKVASRRNNMPGTGSNSYSSGKLTCGATSKVSQSRHIFWR